MIGNIQKKALPKLIYFVKTMPNRACFRMRFEFRDDRRKLVWLPPIIRIEKSDNFSSTLRNSVVKCRTLAAVFLRTMHYTRGEFLDDLR